MNDEWDDARNREDSRPERCRCRGEMPGRCPGPANCPMEERDPEENADAD